MFGYIGLILFILAFFLRLTLTKVIAGKESREEALDWWYKMDCVLGPVMVIGLALALHTVGWWVVLGVIPAADAVGTLARGAEGNIKALEMASDPAWT